MAYWLLMRSSISGLLHAFKELLSGLSIFILGVLLGILLLAYLLAGEIYDYQDSVIYPLVNEELPQVDAIVCLAGGRGRLTHGGDLWLKYRSLIQGSPSAKVPVLYFSGTSHQGNWSVVAKQLRPEVLKAIRPENVVIENESPNTDANARWLARYASERHWRRILLVTSSYHMKRAKFIFDHVLRDSEASSLHVDTLTFYQEPFTSRHWRTNLLGIRVTLTEYLKWVYYKSVWRRG